MPLTGTRRTKQSLLDRAPDNNKQVIDAERLRDFIASTPVVGAGVWRDLGAQLEAGALTLEAYRDTALRLPFFRHDQDLAAGAVFSLPHGWDAGDVKLHARLVPMAAGAGTARFRLRHAWVEGEGDALPAVASWTSATVDAALLAAHQYQHQRVALGTLSPPAGADASTLLLVSLERLGTDGADTYATAKDHGTGAANLGLAALLVHHKVTEIGTETEPA